MNILIISNCPLDPNQGSGYVITGFAKGLQARGHQLKAFGPEDFIIIQGARSAKRLRLFIGYTLKAVNEAWFKNTRYDIIELWGGVGWLSCLILTRLRLGKYKVISRSNGLEPYYRTATMVAENRSIIRILIDRFQGWTDKIGFQSADALTIVSKFDELYASKNSYQISSRLMLLENALSNDWLNQEIHKREHFTVGFVGGWFDRKGNKQLIDVINTLSAMGSRCNWIIAGVGKDGEKDLLENTHLSNCSIYPQLPRKDLQNLYHQVSILLCLSSYESFGLMCSEAMSCGCMLMSTNVGFVSGLREGVDYVSINRYDINRISEKLYHFENSFYDYESIAASGYNKVQRLDWLSNITKLEQYYIDLFCSKL